MLSAPSCAGARSQRRRSSARRIQSAADFWSSGRGITGAQNGIAIAGEFLSAAAVLLAERMRHANRYTMADVLALRLPIGRVLVASGVSTMCIAAFYVVAQSVAAGSLIEALVGVPYWASVLITVAAILTYRVLGGMVSTT